jgi:benzoylformate decarboxylase
MRLRDPVLGHDLVAMAKPLVKWSTQVNHADEMAAVMQRAFNIANEAPKGPVFVALPINVMEEETATGAWSGGPVYAEAQPDPAGIESAVALLAAARKPVIVAGDDVARAGAVPALVELAESLGAPVFQDTLRQHVVFPNRHAAYAGLLPLDAASIRSVLSDADLVLMLGGPCFEEVWHDSVRPVPEGAKIVQLAHCSGVLARNLAIDVGVVCALRPGIESLRAALTGKGNSEASAARMSQLESQARQRDDAAAVSLDRIRDARPMAPLVALTEIAAAIPSEGIVVDESITATGDVARAFDFRAPGDYFGQRGGGIGQGIAGALGVAVAKPERAVVAISGDGSAMYTIQSLWTAALLKLRIVFVILANREYRVLKHNMDAYRARFDAASNRPYPHMDLAPTLDFATLARGMGVPSTRIDDPNRLQAALRAAVAEGGPYLLEVVVSGKQ